MICLGIESTAHTFGIGIVKFSKNKIKILSNKKDTYKPRHGSGIHPLEAMNHHKEVSENILRKSLENAKINLSDVDILSYSAGPGLPPCLKIGLEFTKDLDIIIFTFYRYIYLAVVASF